MLRVVPTKDLMGILSPVLCSDSLLEKDDGTGIYSMLPFEEFKYNYLTSTGLSPIPNTGANYHALT
jgi:hypothetical protein